MIARLFRDHRGTSVIELGLVMPLLLVVLGGISDGSRLVAAKLKLQQAADLAVGLASAGGVSSPAFSTIQAEAASAAGVTADHVTVSYWLECDGVRQSSFDGTCGSSQQIGRFAGVAISSSYTPMFPWTKWMVSGGNSSVSISADATVRVQ